MTIVSVIISCSASLIMNVVKITSKVKTGDIRVTFRRLAPPCQDIAGETNDQYSRASHHLTPGPYLGRKKAPCQFRYSENVKKMREVCMDISITANDRTLTFAVVDISLILFLSSFSNDIISPLRQMIILFALLQDYLKVKELVIQA